MPYVELLYLRRSAFWSLRGYVTGITGLGVVLLIKLCFYTVKRTTDRYFVILFCDFQRLIQIMMRSKVKWRGREDFRCGARIRW